MLLTQADPDPDWPLALSHPCADNNFTVNGPFNEKYGVSSFSQLDASDIRLLHMGEQCQDTRMV